VVTVSEPITRTLQERYQLGARPALVLNVPVDDTRTRPNSMQAIGSPTVREAVKLAAEVPLLVYSGAVSRARGVDILIDALAHLPGVHVVVVPVPFPHPHQGELVDRAVALGVEDRLHFAPPVGQDRLLHYLSGATLAVMPLRTGSANIAQALPNKLFENLHAGLTMVTSDAKLMAAFVTEHDLGEVFRDGDAADLAAAVRRALANPRDSHGEHWEQLRRQYSWQGQEPAIRELYSALVPPPEPGGIDDPSFPSLSVTDAAASPSVPVEHRRSVRPDRSDVPAVGLPYDQEGATTDDVDPDGVSDPADPAGHHTGADPDDLTSPTEALTVDRRLS
jgi:glycosyltransferase involved in cell wall biosynthesis